MVNIAVSNVLSWWKQWTFFWQCPVRADSRETQKQRNNFGSQAGRYEHSSVAVFVLRHHVHLAESFSMHEKRNTRRESSCYFSFNFFF